MIINISNNGNTVILSTFTESSYDRLSKHNCFGHDVTSIGLGYPPICKWTLPHFGLSHNLCKNISNSWKNSIFLIPLPALFCNWGGGSNYVFVPLQKFEYLYLEGFIDTEFDRIAQKRVIYRIMVDSVVLPHLISQPIQ